MKKAREYTSDTMDRFVARSNPERRGKVELQMNGWDTPAAQEVIKEQLRSSRPEPKLSAKEFLLSRYLPTISEEERELWYSTYPFAQQIVEIMEQYKNQ